MGPLLTRSRTLPPARQSQHHDIGIARKLGYKVCWIERRQGMKGFGGTPEVPELTKPDFHFATMKAFADAAVGR